MQKKTSKVKKLLLQALACFVPFGAFVTAPVYADSMPVSSKVQAALFLKILSYDKGFKVGDNLKVGIFYSGNSKSSDVKNEILPIFQTLSNKGAVNFNLSFTGISKNEIANIKNSGLNIIYVTPENKDSLETISKIARSAGILTMTGVPEYVEDGSLSVAIGLKGGSTPEIIVNLNTSKAEGRDFSSQLLKLAKVIR